MERAALIHDVRYYIGFQNHYSWIGTWAWRYDEYCQALFQSHYGWIGTRAELLAAAERLSFQSHYGWIGTVRYVI